MFQEGTVLLRIVFIKRKNRFYQSAAVKAATATVLLINRFYQPFKT